MLIDNLEKILKKYGKICVAYSGGTDSDFLLNMAAKILGKENVLAVLAKGIMLSQKDFDDALRLAQKCGVRLEIVEIDALSVGEFRNNTKERCYFCKKNIMSKVIEKASQLGFDVVADGKNTDDGKVFRPGTKAASELGIVSPLFEAGFSKADIRHWAQKENIETWDKKSNSCLATRFPYDTLLTEDNLKAVEKAEYIIFSKGYSGARVRVHGDIARIEIDKEDFKRFVEDKDIAEDVKKQGFKYVVLDLEGFRSGSMD